MNEINGRDRNLVISKQEKWLGHNKLFGLNLDPCQPYLPYGNQIFQKIFYKKQLN